MAYSMPLWTILAKWPAPTLPACTAAELALGLERVEDRLRPWRRRRRRRRTSGRSRSPGPRRRRRRRSRRSRCPWRTSSSACSGRRSSGSCRRRPRGRPRRAARRARDRRRRVGSPAGHHHPDDPRARQLLDQLLEAVDVGDLGVAVVADDGVPGAADPLAHVAAHLAEADESESMPCPTLRTCAAEQWSRSGEQAARHQQVAVVAVAASPSRPSPRPRVTTGLVAVRERQLDQRRRRWRSGRRAGTAG